MNLSVGIKVADKAYHTVEIGMGRCKRLLPCPRYRFSVDWQVPETERERPPNWCQSRLGRGE